MMQYAPGAQVWFHWFAEGRYIFSYRMHDAGLDWALAVCGSNGSTVQLLDAAPPLLPREWKFVSDATAAQ